MRRKIAFNIREQEIHGLLEYMEERLGGINYSATYFKNKLYVSVIGDKEEVTRSERRVRDLIKEYLLFARGYKGKRYYSLRWVAENGSIDHKLLILVLNKAGYKAERKGDYIETELDPDSMRAIIYNLCRLREKTRLIVRQKGVRNIIIAASYLAEREPLEVLDLALSEGWMEEKERKYYFRRPPMAVLDNLLMVLKHENRSGDIE